MEIFEGGRSWILDLSTICIARSPHGWKHCIRLVVDTLATSHNLLFLCFNHACLTGSITQIGNFCCCGANCHRIFLKFCILHMNHYYTYRRHCIYSLNPAAQGWGITFERHCMHLSFQIRHLNFQIMHWMSLNGLSYWLSLR